MRHEKLVHHPWDLSGKWFSSHAQSYPFLVTQQLFSKKCSTKVFTERARWIHYNWHFRAETYLRDSLHISQNKRALELTIVKCFAGSSLLSMQLEIVFIVPSEIYNLYFWMQFPKKLCRPQYHLALTFTKLAGRVLSLGNWQPLLSTCVKASEEGIFPAKPLSKLQTHWDLCSVFSLPSSFSLSHLLSSILRRSLGCHHPRINYP